MWSIILWILWSMQTLSVGTQFCQSTIVLIYDLLRCYCMWLSACVEQMDFLVSIVRYRKM